MKKIIQVCSLLSLLFLFTAVSASAQSTLGVDVEVPFAFNIAGHSYDSGNYILKVTKFGTVTGTLSIRDPKTDELQIVLLNANGDESADGIKLVFDTIDGRRFLTKIRTPDRTFALGRSKAEKDAAKTRDAARSETSSIGSGADPF